MIGTLDQKTMMMIAGVAVALLVCYYLHKETRKLKAELDTTQSTIVELRKYLEPIPVVEEERTPTVQVAMSEATDIEENKTE